MHYVVSDLHGCYKQYRRLLETIRLREDDTLYVLGDVVDRGADGIRILQDMCLRKNIVPFWGNHDYEAYTLLNGFFCSRRRDDAFLDAFRLWLADGGTPTAKAFEALSDGERRAILQYLASFGTYEHCSVGGKQFFLAHTVPPKEKFSDPAACSLRDFILGRPEYGRVYAQELHIVTGHTPTEQIDETSRGRIWRGSSHIAIDCGAVFGNPLGCLCLETGEEFYISPQ